MLLPLCCAVVLPPCWMTCLVFTDVLCVLTVLKCMCQGLCLVLVGLVARRVGLACVACVTRCSSAVCGCGWANAASLYVSLLLRFVPQLSVYTDLVLRVSYRMYISPTAAPRITPTRDTPSPAPLATGTAAVSGNSAACPTCGCARYHFACQLGPAHAFAMASATTACRHRPRCEDGA